MPFLFLAVRMATHVIRYQFPVLKHCLWLDLSLYMLGHFAYFFVVCRFYNKIWLLKKIRNNIIILNRLEPDQALHFVRSDLDPNWLQKLSEDDKISTSRESINLWQSHNLSRWSYLHWSMHITLTNIRHSGCLCKFHGIRPRVYMEDLLW